MTWVKLDEAMPDHPKVEGLSDRAFRWLVRSWCHAARFKTDGHLADGYARTVPPKVRDELIASGLWERNGPAGLVVHDYLVYNPSRDEILEDREKKAAAGRRGGIARAVKARRKASE